MKRIVKYLIVLLVGLSIVIPLLMCHAFVEEYTLPMDTLLEGARDCHESLERLDYYYLELKQNGNFYFYDTSKTKRHEGNWHKSLFCRNTIIFEIDGKRDIALIIYNDASGSKHLSFSDTNNIFGQYEPDIYYILPQRWK